MNARFLTVAVLLLGLIPWAVFSVSCGFADDSPGKIPTINAGGGGGSLPDDPGGDDPLDKDGPVVPSEQTVNIVVNAVVEVSEEISNPSQVEIGDTLWELGIRSVPQIIAYAKVLDIPPSVWAEYKAEKLTHQIEDEWWKFLSIDPDLETFIYGMTIYDVSEMAEGYSDWSGFGM